MQFRQIIINYQTSATRIDDPDRCLQLECPHREKTAYVSGGRHKVDLLYPVDLRIHFAGQTLSTHNVYLDN